MIAEPSDGRVTAPTTHATAAASSGGAAVFLSAFLVFQIEPLVGKYALPWYGGTPALWTTCLVVFQVLLACGYAYAHGLSRLDPHVQVRIHLVLLAAAAFGSIVPGDGWKPHGSDDPLLRVAAMLLSTVGLPYFALAATGPLLQSWRSRLCPERSPYGLYACSNAGSLLALLSYPLVVEPRLEVGQQASLWRVGYACFFGLCAVSAWRLRRPRPAAPPVTALDRSADGTGWDRRALWFAWSACGVVLFMAVTNQLTLNVASTPFLWVIPLATYLATYVLAFGSGREYPRAVLAVATVGGTLTLVALTIRESTDVVAYGLALFALCFACHGELYRLRPPASRLTVFYLWIALGGAAGGLVVGVLAPLAFLLAQELQLGLLGCCVLHIVTAALGRPRRRWPVAAGTCAVIGLAAVLTMQSIAQLAGAIGTRRNFYGLLRVRTATEGLPRRTLFDGSTLHGYELTSVGHEGLPTSYYSPLTGIGRLMTWSERGRPRRIGLVGLGIGTLAAYPDRSDHLRIYEINPDVVEVATSYFGFLARCRARWEVVLGDARLSLEREAPQAFDILVLDAFGSDAVPIHLLTVEAFDTYERHLARNGVLAVHISNRHLDLSAVVYSVARDRGLRVLQISNRDLPQRATTAANWMLLTKDVETLRALAASLQPLHASGDVILANRTRDEYASLAPWTDGYSNLLRILR